jgi:glutamyl-tRNA synthetase
MYNGKMIMRFDDTNPAKEKDEFVQSILGDLATLGISYDIFSYTSDYFEYFLECMDKCIDKGLVYCDNTPVEKMREERGAGIESKARENTIKQNQEIWAKMKKGELKDTVVRAKWDMQDKNKCMRDPVFYRYNDTPHHRTGKKYKIYPTYDFACPIIDSKEGVTHAMRTNEYSDRIAQYKKVLEMTGHRDVTIYEFSRLNFVRTVLSKRKLQGFVDSGSVTGWEDPRFPTVRGIMRRGIQIPTLVEFMLEQGPSKRTNLQEWDKFWATNFKHIDLKAGRYTAISREKVCTLVLNTNKYTSEPQGFQIALHPKNADLGNRLQFRTNELYLEFEDAKDFKVDQKITLMNWGNATIKDIKPEGDAFKIFADLNEEDTDFKSTLKISWLPKTDMLTEVDLVEYDHLITTDKIDEEALEKEGKTFEDIVNQNTRFVTKAFADPNIQNL